MAGPARNLSRRGRLGYCMKFGKRTCKPNSVVCGHSSRRRVAADARQRPTRRFRQLLEPPVAHRAGAQRRLALGGIFPPYLVLLRVGFTLPPPLPTERCALTAPFHPYPGAGIPATASEPGKPGQLGYCVSREALGKLRRAGRGVAEAVSFLWHWPSASLEARIPDVIRHTALRSSDFPPPGIRRNGARQRPPGPPANIQSIANTLRLIDLTAFSAICGWCERRRGAGSYRSLSDTEQCTAARR